MCNLGSNYPYLLHKMGFVNSLTHTTICMQAGVVELVAHSVQLSTDCFTIFFQDKKNFEEKLTELKAIFLMVIARSLS